MNRAHVCLGRAALLASALSLAPNAQAQRVPLGTLWTLYRSAPFGAEVTLGGPGTPTLLFDAGRLVGSTGCNTYSAGYLASGHDLKVGAVLSTRAACPTPAQSRLEERFLNALGQVKRFQVTGDFLVLFTEDRQTLVFTRTP